MKTNAQKRQILLTNQKINNYVTEALNWYFTTDFEPVPIGRFLTYGKFKGRSREQLVGNAVSWWEQFGATLESTADGNTDIHYFEGTSQCISLWFNNIWVMYEIPYDEEISELFDKLGLRSQRKTYYSSMKNVTLFRLAR